MKMSSWRQYTQPWYYGYAFQGLAVFGTGAILMPILVNKTDDAARAGIVMAFFYMGQLISPLIGVITNRTGYHRLIYLSGYVLLAIGLVLFPVTNIFWFWMALAFLQGAGSSTSNTVAGMLIVEYNPKTEWDARIGWLQTFYGIGQAVGLGLAAILQTRPAIGLFISASLMVPAILFGSRGLPSPNIHRVPKTIKFSHRLHRPPRTIYSILSRYEGIASTSLQYIIRESRTKFGIFIIGWFFAMLTTWLIGALFPLLMKGAFNIPYGLSSLYFAAGAIIGIFAYTPAGIIGKKIGDGWVVIIGTTARLISVTGLALLSYYPSNLNQLLVPIVYIIFPIAWSPLIVGGTSWAAQLANSKEGEALGIFNGITAIAAVIAAFTAGIVAYYLDYNMILISGVAASVLALICFASLIPHAKRNNSFNALAKIFRQTNKI
jgi:DHA1 family tetracycline resistance protein-like MFS transporter